jgi:RHS repeat-associated protein
VDARQRHQRPGQRQVRLHRERYRAVVHRLQHAGPGRQHLPGVGHHLRLARPDPRDPDGAGQRRLGCHRHRLRLGRQTTTSGPYYETSLTAGTIIGAAEDLVNAQDTQVYDGAGRVVRDISSSQGTETWETDTSYGGNYTTTTYSCSATVPSCGGTPETTFTNGLGLTTAIDQYHSGVPANPSDPASDYDKTSYAYTPAKQLAGITDSAGNSWAYTYDLNGNTLTESDPDAGTTTSTYDAAGQLLTTTSADGKTTSYVYDKDGRKTAEYDTTGDAPETASNEIASWTYDTLAKGQLTSSSSYYGGQAYTEAVGGYNAFGEPTETYTTIPSAQGKLAGNYVTEDNYTATGQLASYEDSAAGGLPQETVSYGYNTAGQPVSATGIWAYVSSLSYGEYGLPQEYELGPTSAPAYVVDSYDPQTQRLTEQQTSAGVTPQVIDDQKYTYDNVGDILSENDTPASGPAQAQCFQYDYLGRLVQAWSQGASCTSTSTPSATAESGAAAPYWDTYTYNAIGNLTSLASTGTDGTVTTTTETYPATGAAQPHAPTQQTVSGGATGATSYSYDAAGQLTSESGSTSESLAWADDGELASITSPATATSPTSSYLYDSDGNLLIEKDPGQTTLFLADEEIVLNTAANTMSGTRYYTIGGSTMAARTSAGSVQYLVGDQQGTSSVAIDSATLAVTRRYYDPYGNELGPEPASWPGVKGFIGGTQDTATGLTNLGAREYNPASAQFISPDPLIDPSDPQDLNPYAYAGDSPATDSDPSGAAMTRGGGGGSSTPPPGQCWYSSSCGLTTPPPGIGSPGNSGSGSGSRGTNRGGSNGTSGGSGPYGASSYFTLNPEICGLDCLSTLTPDKPQPKGPGAKAATTRKTNGSLASDGCGPNDVFDPSLPGGKFVVGEGYGSCVGKNSGAEQTVASNAAARRDTTSGAVLVMEAEDIAGLPDYVNYCESAGPYTQCLTVTRDLSVYKSMGLGLSSTPAVSYTGGFILGPHTNADIDSFVSGPSLGLTGPIGVDDLIGGVTWGNEGECCKGDFAAEMGVSSSPGYSFSQSYTDLIWRP